MERNCDRSTALPRLVSLSTLAKKWDVSATTVRRLLDDAGVNPIFLSRKKGGTVRYPLEDIKGFIEASSASPEA